MTLLYRVAPSTTGCVQQVFDEMCCGLTPGYRALVSDVREDSPKEGVQQSAAQIDPKIMRWEQKHLVGQASAVQAYTVQKIESVIDGIPPKDLCVEVAGTSLAVWPAR